MVYFEISKLDENKYELLVCEKERWWTGCRKALYCKQNTCCTAEAQSVFFCFFVHCWLVSIVWARLYSGFDTWIGFLLSSMGQSLGVFCLSTKEHGKIPLSTFTYYCGSEWTVSFQALSLDRALSPNHRVTGHSNDSLVKHRFPLRKTRFGGTSCGS